MSNLFKSGSSTLASKVTGSQSIGVNGSADYGPSSSTGFYNGITIPSGSRLITYVSTSGTPYFHVAPNDTSTIFFLKSFGSSGSTITDVLGWAANQSQYSVLTADLTVADLPNITPTPTPSITPTRASGTTPTPTPTLTPTNTPTVTQTNTNTNTPTPTITDTPTPTPTITDTPTATPTPTPTVPSPQYYYGTTDVLAYGMTSGLTSFSFNIGSDLCAASSMNATQFGSLNYGDTIYIYDSINGGTRQGSSVGYGSTSINFTAGCTYQQGRYRVATSVDGVCNSFTGFTDANFYGSDITTVGYFASYQLTGLGNGTYYLYDTVTFYERQFTNSSSTGSTLFNFSGSYTSNNCPTPTPTPTQGITPTPTPTPAARSGYYVGSTIGDAVTGGTQLTNVNLYGSNFCTSNTGINADQFASLSGTFYVYSVADDQYRQVNSYNSTLASFSGSCSTPTPTPTPGARSGYYVASTYSDAITGGTQLTNVNLYSYTFCQGNAGINADQFSSMSGIFYVYSVTDNQYRQISSSGGSTLVSFIGSCT